MNFPPPLYLLTFILLFLYGKGFPFIYHVRAVSLLLWQIGVLLFHGHGFRSPMDVYETTHMVTLSDLDWNMHQNNSNYALESDLARYPFYVMLIGGLNPYLFPMWRLGWRLALGGLSSWFLKEMRLHQVYTIRTRLASVDKKWFYVVSYFESGATLFAIQLSRVVIKSGRKSITPREVLTTLGYANADIDALESLEAPSAPREEDSLSASLKAAGPLLSALSTALLPPHARPLPSPSDKKD